MSDTKENIIIAFIFFLFLLVIANLGRHAGKWEVSKGYCKFICETVEQSYDDYEINEGGEIVCSCKIISSVKSKKYKKK